MFWLSRPRVRALANTRHLCSTSTVTNARPTIRLKKYIRPRTPIYQHTAPSSTISRTMVSSPISATPTELPASSIPIFTTIAAYRAWRKKAFDEGKSVGYVPTMGALHEGHMTLVRRSLAENDLTVVSIFVNPAQFAPHEDLATYPRTLPRDLELLEAEQLTISSEFTPTSKATKRSTSAVFAPTVMEMYPSGIVQNVAEQKGTFVEVKGYGHQMEGTSRPTFFRGVATVVTKLFNAVQPINAYFGQKDIQQALLLKRLCRDLLFAYPESQNLHIVPTARDSVDGLALSSRNAYLTLDGRKVAATLYQALLAAEAAWTNGLSKKECIEQATNVVAARKKQAQAEGLEVEMELDYIQLNYVHSFEMLEEDVKRGDDDTELVILSGALKVDTTRLIDNILIGSTAAMP